MAIEHGLDCIIGFQQVQRHPLWRRFIYLRYRHALSGACNPSTTITRVGTKAIFRRHTKVRVTIRLDRDVVEHFRDQVRGARRGNYQTLINDALREHIQ